MQMKPAVTNWDGLDKLLIAWLWIVARLKPGVDPEALGHELGAKLRVFQEQHISEAAGFSPATLRIIRQRSIRLDPLRGRSPLRPRRRLPKGPRLDRRRPAAAHLRETSPV